MPPLHCETVQPVPGAQSSELMGIGMMGEPWARGHSEAEWGRTNVTVVSALDLDPYFGALHACVEWSPTRGSAVPLPWSA